MGISKKLLIFLFLILGSFSYSYNITNIPTIDFGSVGHLYGNSSGFNTITVKDGFSNSTGGSGQLLNFSGGSIGAIILGNFDNLLDGIRPAVEMLSVNQQISTEGCGSVTITALTTKDGNTYYQQWRGGALTVSFPLGGTLIFNSITATSACYIQGTLSNAYRHRSSSFGSWSTESVNIRVYVVPHMALAHNEGASLNFGSVCSAGYQQSITIAPDETISYSTLMCPLANTSADAFTVTGNNGQSFSVNLPGSAVISSGSNDLTVSNLRSSCLSNCVLSGHTYNIKVGGTLTIPPHAVLGDYYGTYQVTITY